MAKFKVGLVVAATIIMMYFMHYGPGVLAEASFVGWCLVVIAVYLSG